ncbi:MAG TPA: hypothetical protein VNN73_16960 [Blastocatellia bacterium]|nr:hypothetical protein [Blastocatellia bacterium]
MAVNEVLPIKATLTTDELINRINTYAEVQTFSADSYFQVINYFTKDVTKADQFPAAIGKLRLKRPENIRVQVTAPVVGKKVADMFSNGEGFKLAVFYPDDKRSFIYGSNVKEIERMGAEEVMDVKDKDIQRAGGLVNMRPQHITDAFLIKPITDRTSVFREEVRQTEPLPGRKDRLIERSYYVIYVFEKNEQGNSELRRKFWFDRTQGNAPLVRQQTFENGNGRLASDITYSEWHTVAGTNREWFGIAAVDRRADGYKLVLDMDKETIELNGDLPETVFQLENTDHLKEINMDEPRKTNAETVPKAPASQKQKPNSLMPKH